MRAAKNSNFKEPNWLLPMEKTRQSNDKNEWPNRSLFEFIVTTSKDYGSGMSDPNTGILIAVIGEEGGCFMHRIPVIDCSITSETDEWSHESIGSSLSLCRFQRGAKDVFFFHGPDVGKLEAVWIAPEEGTWRIQNLMLKVLPEGCDKDYLPISENRGSKIMQYHFVCEEALIGENELNSALELHVHSVSEIPYEEFLVTDSDESVNQTILNQKREEGMKEYEELKSLLLTYDAVLIIAGSAIASLIGTKEVFEGYLIGGILGFLYLLILERAVDQLQVQSSSSVSIQDDQIVSVQNEIKDSTENPSVTINKRGVEPAQVFSVFRTPLTKLSGFLAVSVLLVKALNQDNQVLSKEMLFAGVIGFMMTKAATILASSVPMLSRKRLHSSKTES
ncbi:hypothetical protein KP509_04G100200 [Ceratopteris richardii]|uniref:DUF7755 domain-containing protein n=1 Tax=Ceratopteris richardii TaxID=49495 RepID=A0A8T2V7M1_CERRI|nr:hypothetical protein KP509_04G100200 [Ceratopteris richardii]KAH7440300.1 hypothetical protein KP509_04G100200 [Ceratopteris richardii]